MSLSIPYLDRKLIFVIFSAAMVLLFNLVVHRLVSVRILQIESSIKILVLIIILIGGFHRIKIRVLLVNNAASFV